MPLPQFVKKYFWDIDTSHAHLKKHPSYYTNRILEFGDKSAVSWLFRVFGRQKIKRTLSGKKLSVKSKNFWKIVMD